MQLSGIPCATTDWSQITRGMSYQVADNAEAHRSSTALGARLFIVD